ncbi:hypothetical protein H6F44_00970 [Pseudanabaena sp. FACHB-1277]|uniref:Uncharacterized protein n=1 Tax=Pseudanabaena cinerea FACHB-1277 TaxID=2949581 RepID=A0A926URI6_9CYAN|nr:hypothetical protein [Pseudanabaena cinerea]MBD2148705.1 hypothetical protein [Pseudanabaena cinerea FACHB-1277]
MAQATDKSIFMLPKLRDSKVKHGAAGKWNRQSATAFDDVARSIDVIVNTEVANVNSIPSMWAHPLALQSVLSSNDYNDRIRIPLINQWRGMLTAIALAPDFQEVGRLTAKFIDLTDPAYRNNKFIQSLFRLAPSTNECLFALEHNLNPWLQSYVFCWNGRAIGMTSPSTIVCPAEDANWTGLPWFVNGQVQSPERYLNNDQKIRLSRWLVYLRRQISADSLGIHNQISTLINEFIDALGGDKNQALNPATELLNDDTYFGILIEIAFYASILRPSDLLGGVKFFLSGNDLYFLRRPNAFPNANIPDSLKNLTFAGSPISVILPIEPKFFNRDDAANLLQTLKVESLKANTVLKFSIQIDGHNLEKQYELKNENVISGLPVAEIWPNFTSPNWKIYYSYYYDVDETQLNFEFSNITNPQVNIHRFSTSQVSRLDSFPKHIACYYHDRVIGAIALKTPVAVLETNKQWNVGVDFGTSFTNVYKKQGEYDEKMSFDDLHFSITLSDPDTRTSSLTENFIPLSQKLPIASLLSVKNGRIPVTRHGNVDAEIIFDGRIYVPSAINKLDDGKDCLISNLKWNNLDNQEPMRLFIEQLALQVSAQAVKSGVSQIQWALSYPTAFSRRDKSSYVDIWNDCSEKLFAITGLRYEDLRANSNAHFRSESLAVAHYFSSKKGKSLLNAACIDIGGGTSDISIWEEHKNGIVPVYQCSVQLAGKHLFSDIMRRDPEFLRHINFATDDTLINLRNSKSLFATAMDALAKECGDEWLRSRRRRLQGNERLYKYLQILAIGIAGLHYYAGLVLQVLHKEDADSPRRYKAGKPVNVYFGGNGCRLLNWLSDTGKFENDEIGELFQEMTIKASEFQPLSKSNAISDQPKEEAACGLVVGQKRLGDPSGSEQDLIAGEPCKIGSRVFTWNSYIAFDADISESIDTLQVVTDPNDLVNLPKFIYWFQKGLRRRRDIQIPVIKGYSLGNAQNDDDNLRNTVADNYIFWDRVVDKLRDSLILDNGATTENIRLEPPFILALKALIEVLAEEWVSR